MAEVGAVEAKNNLSALIERAERGEEIVITRSGRPVAKLVPFQNMPGSEQAIQAAERIRVLAEDMALGAFDWNEWKAYRDEGRR